MLALDTSLLAYAVNRHAPEHARAARVVEQLADGALPWALPWPVVHEFLRLVTHRHAVAQALSPADAWAFIEALLASHSVRLLGPGEGHAAALADVLASLQPGAGVPAGLEVVAVLREHGVRELLTADAGMKRFAFLLVRDPVHGRPWTPGEAPQRRYRVLRPRPGKA
jgi:toxin-antitoxin system PIN domain toxin